MVELGMGTPTYAAQPPVTKHAMPALCLQGAVINKQTGNEYTEKLKPPAKRVAAKYLAWQIYMTTVGSSIFFNYGYSPGWCRSAAGQRRTRPK